MEQSKLFDEAKIVIQKFGNNFKLLKHPTQKCPLVISQQAAMYLFKSEDDIYILKEQS